MYVPGHGWYVVSPKCEICGFDPHLRYVSIQTKHTKAYTYLRSMFIAEHRKYYLEEKEKESLPEAASLKERKGRDARAWGRAHTRLKKQHPEEYQRCIERAKSEGYPNYFYTKGGGVLMNS